MPPRKPQKTSANPNSLSLRVQKLRIAAGLTQRQLAEKMGSTPGYVGGIETHPNFDPKVSTLRRLADALGCSIIDLFAAD